MREPSINPSIRTTWQRVTNVWRRVTDLARGPQRLALRSWRVRSVRADQDCGTGRRQSFSIAEKALGAYCWAHWWSINCGRGAIHAKWRRTVTYKEPDPSIGRTSRY